MGHFLSGFVMSAICPPFKTGRSAGYGALLAPAHNPNKSKQWDRNYQVLPVDESFGEQPYQKTGFQARILANASADLGSLLIVEDIQPRLVLQRGTRDE